MNHAVMLHGGLASHRRGGVLRETLDARETLELPAGPAALLMFGEEYQSAGPAEKRRLVEWTRTGERLLLLVPPFAVTSCECPVPWTVERLQSAPRDGTGVARLLAGEVAYRLGGRLGAAQIAGSTWTDLSVCTGAYRSHPTSGLFAVTCLPLWSLTTLDAPAESRSFLEALMEHAGTAASSAPEEPPGLSPDHFGFLVFLLSEPFESEARALESLAVSPIFGFAQERARTLLQDLQDRGLVTGVALSAEGRDLLMNSPYAIYVSAMREVSR